MLKTKVNLAEGFLQIKYINKQITVWATTYMQKFLYFVL